MLGRVRYEQNKNYIFYDVVLDQIGCIKSKEDDSIFRGIKLMTFQTFKSIYMTKSKKGIVCKK